MPTHPDSDDNQPPVTTLDQCPNCGSDLSGEFCQTCGQKKIDRKELSVVRFVRNSLGEFADLESNKILKTLAALLIRPGQLPAEYLAGRRGKIITPIRLYLTFSAIYFLFAWGTLSDVRGGGAMRAARSPATIAMAKERGITPQALAERAFEKAEKYAGALRFASVLVSGLFLSLLYIGVKRFYVEHLVFSLYYYSFDFCSKSIFALVFLIAAAFGRRLPAAVLNSFYPIGLVYLIFALHQAYKQSWPKTIVKAVALFVLETALFIAVNIAGFIIAFSMV